MAPAHKVSVFAYVDGDSIRTESYFADGGKCRGAQVRLLTAAGGQVDSGRTNEEGLLALARPAVDAAGGQGLMVVVDAGGGHRAQFRLRAGDLGPQAAPATAIAAPGVPPAAPGGTVPVLDPPLPGDLGADSQVAPPPLPELEAAVDVVVERRLAPVMQALRALEQAQERARFRDAVGGIGYILGLLGVYSYLRGRRR